MYTPDKVLDNKYFESIVETNDEWIKTRTGISERRILEDGATSDLAARAALDLFEKHNVDPKEIDAIIVATVTPDMFFPATACLVQNKIGAINAWGFDLSAACSGFLLLCKQVPYVSAELMEKSNLKSEDIAYLVPHQANLRIIDATAQRMGISKDKVMINIDKYGNTTAATIPLCLTEYYRAGKVKKGDNLILSAFGAGYTWGAIHVVWAI
ncbi:MAG: hypothetical protein IPJ23_03490 [Ignavibacteriales bacterium]|nr:hypothetical protein [Ignavibacteriales bacterium]